MNICIITPMASELNALEKSFSSLEKKGPLLYKSGDNEIHLFKCGVLFRNPKRLKRKLDILGKSDLVILCGICGAASEKLKIGDIVIPDKIILLDNKTEFFDNPKDCIADYLAASKSKVIDRGILATSDHFVTKDEKTRLSHIDIVDMESYNVLKCLSEYNIPVLCVRSVSDVKSQSLPDEKTIVRYISDPKKFIVTNCFKSPIICYKLLKLSFFSNIALNSLAKFIKSFLMFQTKVSVEAECRKLSERN